MHELLRQLYSPDFPAGYGRDRLPPTVPTRTTFAILELSGNNAEGLPVSFYNLRVFKGCHENTN